MRTIKVLLVDDNEMFLRGAALALCGLRGIQVSDSVTSGLEALSHVQGETPDLVLLDFNMPDMNGVETAWRLRGTGYTGKIVMMSCWREGEIRARWPNVESDAFIDKQHFFEGMAEVIERVVPCGRNAGAVAGCAHEPC